MILVTLRLYSRTFFSMKSSISLQSEMPQFWLANVVNPSQYNSNMGSAAFVYSGEIVEGTYLLADTEE